MIPFGDMLQKLRAEKRWTQAQLAERLNISASQIANYELGRRFPSLQVLIDISHIFGVSTDYLLGLNTSQEHLLNVSDLTPHELESVCSVIDCYREARK